MEPERVISEGIRKGLPERVILEWIRKGYIRKSYTGGGLERVIPERVRIRKGYTRKG